MRIDRSISLLKRGVSSSGWYEDTLGICPSPSPLCLDGPHRTTHPPTQAKPKALQRALALKPSCPVDLAPPLLNWKVRPPTRFTVLDRASTRLSSLYCQCSCQATILLENRGLLQQAQAVITLQIQALKKQSNSWNGPIIFLHEPIFQMQ